MSNPIETSRSESELQRRLTTTTSEISDTAFDGRKASFSGIVFRLRLAPTVERQSHESQCCAGQSQRQASTAVQTSYGTQEPLRMQRGRVRIQSAPPESTVTPLPRRPE